MAALIWYVVMTERHRENPVAREIEAMGFPTWVPLETRYHRHKSRKRSRSRIWDAPCLPGVVFAAVPSAAHGDLQTLRYPCTIMRDFDGCALPVADAALSKFRAELDKVNRHNRRCYNRLMQDKPPGKRKWVRVSIDNLADMLADLSRLEIMEEAA